MFAFKKMKTMIKEIILTNFLKDQSEKEFVVL